jgi:hypothetical protein
MPYTQPAPMPELVLTPEQQERMARLSPELQREYRRVLELTMWRERSRKLEGPRVTLPPDTSRWSGRPPPPSAPPAEPSPERPSGWAKFDPLSSPPGIDMIDRMVEADTRRQREDAIAAEVQRRQAIIDMYHEAKVVDEQQRRAAAEARGFHKSPQDDDFNLR